MWRLEWKDLPTLGERQQQAVATSHYIASAIRSYDLATRKHFDYYNAINVVSFLKLLEHLKSVTGEEPVDCQISDPEDLTSVVRFAAQNALDCASSQGGQDIWAAAALGELQLLAGDAKKAQRVCSQAANAPDSTYFQINSMLEQIYLFESLGFRHEAVGGVKKVLEQRRNILEKRIGGLKKSDPRFRRVVVFSGHMIDKPGRSEERFPPRKENAVRERIAKQLDVWTIGAGDVAICGGARGGDILFAELCADRGVGSSLFLPLRESQFLEESVRLPDSDWEQHFFALRDREGVRVLLQRERLKSPPKGASVFSRNNLWMINTARFEANDPKNLTRPAGLG